MLGCPTLPPPLRVSHRSAGGVAAPAGDMQLPLMPGLLHPLGGEPFGAPPLPDQPPLPGGWAHVLACRGVRERLATAR